MRALAPQRRNGMNQWRVLREPSVSWLPYLASSPGACTTRTRLHSASSSSATIFGRLVRTPWPISERATTMLTVPSGAIETKIAGLSRKPLGMPSPPYFFGSSAARPVPGRPTTNTRPLKGTAARNERRVVPRRGGVGSRDDVRDVHAVSPLMPAAALMALRIRV